MEAVKTIRVLDPFRETQRALAGAEKDRRFLECSGIKLIKLLQEVRYKLTKKGVLDDHFSELETRWEKMAVQKPKADVMRKTIMDTQNYIDEMIFKEEKERMKDHTHKIRNALQKLFLGDKQEISVHWESFHEMEEFLKDDMFENAFSTILNKFQPTIGEWRRIYNAQIFLIKKDKAEAYLALKRQTLPEDLARLGKNLEKLLDEITGTLLQWETEKKLN